MHIFPPLLRRIRNFLRNTICIPALSKVSRDLPDRTECSCDHSLISQENHSNINTGTHQKSHTTNSTHRFDGSCTLCRCTVHSLRVRRCGTKRVRWFRYPATKIRQRRRKRRIVIISKGFAITFNPMIGFKQKHNIKYKFRNFWTWNPNLK